MRQHPIRLAIISSHPIQYNAPLFKELADRPELDVKVFYSWAGTSSQKDPEFGIKIAWDVPLLEGYEHCFVPNRAARPGTHHFLGLNNPEIICEVERWRPDALLVYGWAFRTHLAVLRHFKNRVPIFFRGDSTLYSARGFVRSVLRKPLLRWVYRHVDSVFYVGRRNRDYYLACGVSEGQLRWVPHSIDTERFGENGDLEEKASGIRSKLGISNGAVVHLFAGKLISRKRPELLLRAFLELSREEPDEDRHLVIAGAGPLESSLKSIASGHPRVHFLGFQNQSMMPLTYRVGDVFVLPSSERETWGLAVNEAMASGCAIIVSDEVGCAPDLAEGFDYACVFSSGCSAELKQSLRRFSCRTSLKPLGAHARRVIQGWSTQSAADRIVAAAVMQFEGPP